METQGAALAQCLQESDCVMVERNTASACLREPLVETLPTLCRQLRHGLGECKRNMIDMRKRFRGTTPINAAGQREADAANTSYQLYGGKPAFRPTAHYTAGDEPEPVDWREVENQKYRAEQEAAAKAAAKNSSAASSASSSESAAGSGKKS